MNARKDSSISKPKLAVHEWLAIVFIIVTMASLTILSFSSGDFVIIKTGDMHHLIEQEIVIYVRGAVENEGAYRIKRGSTIKELLKTVKMTPEADLSKMKMEAKVRNGQVIKIPNKKRARAPKISREQSRARVRKSNA